MILTELIPILASKEETCRFAKENGLIKKHRLCQKCSKPMTWTKEDSQDGFIWRCWRRTCRKGVSIRLGSFFKDSRLSISQCLYAMYMWARDIRLKQAVIETQISKPTLIDLYRFCRDICFFHFKTNGWWFNYWRRWSRDWDRRVSSIRENIIVDVS